MAKISDIITAGGVIPAALSGALGKENRGFGLGIVPGFLYKDKYQKDEEERQRREAEAAAAAETEAAGAGMKKGGKVKKMAKGGKVSSASKRADGIAQRGKTRGKVI